MIYSKKTIVLAASLVLFFEKGASQNFTVVFPKDSVSKDFFEDAPLFPNQRHFLSQSLDGGFFIDDEFGRLEIDSTGAKKGNFDFNFLKDPKAVFSRLDKNQFVESRFWPKDSLSMTVRTNTGDTVLHRTIRANFLPLALPPTDLKIGRVAASASGEIFVGGAQRFYTATSTEDVVFVAKFDAVGDSVFFRKYAAYIPFKFNEMEPLYDGSLFWGYNNLSGGNHFNLIDPAGGPKWYGGAGLNITSYSTSDIDWVAANNSVFRLFNLMNAPNDWSMYVARYDTAGGGFQKSCLEMLGSKGRIESIIGLSDGNFLGVAYLYEQPGSMVLFKFSPSIELIWEKTLPLLFAASQILELPNCAGFLISGYSSNSLVLIKTDCDGNASVSIKEAEKPRFSISPNPASDAFFIENLDEKASSPLVFSLFDSKGQLVRTEKLASKKAEIRRGNLPDGLYFLKIEAENGRFLEAQRIVFEN